MTISLLRDPNGNWIIPTSAVFAMANFILARWALDDWPYTGESLQVAFLLSPDGSISHFLIPKEPAAAPPP